MRKFEKRPTLGPHVYGDGHGVDWGPEGPPNMEKVAREKEPRYNTGRLDPRESPYPANPRFPKANAVTAIREAYRERREGRKDPSPELAEAVEKNLSQEQRVSLSIHRDDAKVRMECARKAAEAATEKGTEPCALCHQAPGTTLEHFLPWASGLEAAHSKFNHLPCCEPCNTQKGGAWPSSITALLWQEYWKGKTRTARESIRLSAGEHMAGLFQDFAEAELRKIEDVLLVANGVQRSAGGTLPAQGYRVRGRKRRRR